MVKIVGGVTGSISATKKSLKKGGNSYLSRIPVDGITVRFLTEPDKWVKYSEHFNKADGFFPCIEDCPACDEGGEAGNKSKKYLVNAVNVEDNKVIPLVLPTSLAQGLFKKYERYGTLLDRDYELSKEGTGFDTSYDFEPMSPERMNLKRYEQLDLMDALVAQLASDDEDDEDDDEPVSTTRKTSRQMANKRRPLTKSSRRAQEDDEDDDDERKPSRSKGRTAKPVSKTRAVRTKPPVKISSSSTRKTTTMRRKSSR